MDKKMIEEVMGLEIPQETYERAVEAVKSELLTKYTLARAFADREHTFY